MRRENMAALLERLRGGLVVSCQPVTGGPMDRVEIVTALALAARDGGAVGLRIEGAANVAAVRAACDLPILGLIKRDLPDSPVRITPFDDDVAALARAGADIIAFDATDRPRPASVASLLAAARRHGRLAMADCADITDARAAAGLGVDLVGTTLSGYTGGPVPAEPDLAMVRAAAGMLEVPVVAEGRFNTPADAAAAIAAGAYCVVVGSAITRTEHVTGWFAQAVAKARP